MKSPRPGRRILLSFLVASLACVVILSCTDRKAETPGDAPSGAFSDTAKVDFSFVFVGCNRLGWSAKNPSTANIPQLEQTLKDIANLQQTASLPEPPRYLFFVGDLVRNEQEDDGTTLDSQLAAWQTLWSNGPLAGSQTELVPIPGNHEVLYSTKYQDPPGCNCDDRLTCTCEYAEIPNPPTYDKWLTWLGDHGYDQHAGNGPTPATDPQDQLVGDNSKLTYSFDTTLANGKKAHFVLINTDTDSSFRATEASCLQSAQFSGDPLPGWIPAHWIDGDVAAAENDADTELIFALGHKPIEAVHGNMDAKGRETILNCGSAPLADQFLTTLQKKSKVAGYLTAHAHDWQAATPGGVHQIIAGNGGSPPSGAEYFGFTLVRVYTDGKVDAVSYGRPIPNPIDDPKGVGPATPQTTVALR